MEHAKFCAGTGSSDTRKKIFESGRSNPAGGQPYTTVALQEIYNMVADPPTVDKGSAQWIIPSSYTGHDARSHEVQRNSGEFWMMALDIDQGNHPKDHIVDITTNIIGDDCCFVVYSTRSSTEGNRKWRVLIPLGAPIPGNRYTDYQDALFDAFLHFGVQLDSTLRRTGQLVYLPNRGEFYEWSSHGAKVFNAMAHPHLTKRADEYQAVQQQVHANQGNAKTGPFIAQYSEDIETLLERYKFDRKGMSDHWRSPYSESGSYSFQNRGDHWISLSHNDAAQKLGKETANGSRYGDAFDLYVHFEHGGNLDKAVQALKGTIYGAASSGILINYTDPDTGEFFDWLPNPARDARNGYDLAQAVFAQVQREREQLEANRKEELARVKELEDAAEQARTHKWGGPWVNDVPFKFTPSLLEWAAWHAPGVIGEAVRARSVKTARFTLIPLLAGATAAVAHMGQGKFVSLHRQYATPTALMVFVVGESGSGKGDSTGMFYDMLKLVDRTRIKAYRTKTFASGQSLTDYLMHHNSDVMMIQQEGGGARKAGKGDANFESLMNGVTEAFTAFDHGIEVTHTKSDDKEGKVVNHPTVAALMSSTPKKLFASIDSADGESGWLGRNCFMPIPVTNTNIDAAESCTYPQHVSQVLNWIVESIPPLPGQEHPDVWQGRMQAFHALRFTEEATKLSLEMVAHCDTFTTDLRRNEVEKAVYGRAAESVVRLATVAGLAKGGLSVDAECMTWARLVVQQSVDFVLSKMETIEDFGVGDTPESRARRKIKELFRRCDMDNEFWGRFKVSPRRNSAGDIEITKGALKRKVQDDTKVAARVVNDVIADFKETEDIVGIPAGNNKEWLRWLG